MATAPNQFKASPSGSPEVTAGPTALPAWVYNHATLTRLELERILRPSWQIACHTSSIPKPGDYITLDLGSDSILVVRDREGHIRAHHNVCRHRGARLLDGAGHCVGPLVCPYHGWSYGLDGALIGVPSRDTFVNFDKSANGLKSVHTEVYLGFVFVCTTPSKPAQSVADGWAPFAEELAPYRFEELVPLTPIMEDEWPVDWKIAIDNYLESYHVPIGHPGLNRMFTPDYLDQRGAGLVARGTSWIREQPSSRWSERYYQTLLPGLVDHLPKDHQRCWRFYSMLPNIGIDVYPEQMDFFQVLPRGPGKCVTRYAIFGLPDARREMNVLRRLGSRINNEVNKEDRWLCERVQRGLESPSYTPGPLSSIERWLLRFHDLLREQIPETREPFAPQVFAERTVG